MAGNGYNNWNLFLRVFGHFIEIRDIYKEIKNNEEAKKTSTLMAKKTILYSFLFLITLAISFATIIWAISLMQGLAVIFAVVLFVIGITIGIYSLIYLPLALNTLIKQFCLNRKPLAWVALAIFVLIIVGVVIGIVLLTSGAI